MKEDYSFLSSKNTFAGSQAKGRMENSMSNYYFSSPKDWWMDQLKYIPEQYRLKYAAAGIYGIYIEDKLVYIGKSKFMLRRVCEHMGQISSKNAKKSNKYQVIDEAMKRGFKVRFDVIDYISDDEYRGKQEGVYIREYAPILNYQIPREEDWHRYTKNPLAADITLDELLDDLNIEKHLYIIGKEQDN